MKILLIDDHTLFRDGMQLVLSSMDEEIQIFSASSYEEALALKAENPDMDLILLDLGLPGLNDTQALIAIRKEFPVTPVVVVSANNESCKVKQVLTMGAQGYIPKSTGTALLIRALKLVLSGGIYIPPEILNQKETDFSNSPSNEEVTGPNSTTLKPFLTPRQLDVLIKLARGLSNKEISIQLSMAEPTVRAHVAAILKAFNSTNRTQAAHIALKNGWIKIDSKP